MIEQLLEAIKSTLKASFEECTVYTNEVPQGFERPSLFIRNISTERQKQIGENHRFSYTFNIKYFSAAKKQNEDFSAMSERLYTALYFLQGASVFGRDISHRTVDGVLHMQVTYRINAIKNVEQEPSFEDLELRSEIKNG